MAAPPFTEFVASIGRIGESVSKADPTAATIIAGATRLESLPAVTIDSLAALVAENPEWIRVLGLAVGLGQEQLQITLHSQFEVRSFRKLAGRGREVVELLDELGLVQQIEAERARSYTYSDVLLERYGSRARAGRAIGRGRVLEDAVEAVVTDLKLPHSMRTRFIGIGGRTAPCDLAIPAGGAAARIVVGIKGFNSTGSKLTDARREIEEMANVRLPTQVVLAVVDGLGWRSRQADLRVIHALWEQNKIDGLFTQATLAEFRSVVTNAARVLRIEPQGSDTTVAL